MVWWLGQILRLFGVGEVLGPNICVVRWLGCGMRCLSVEYGSPISKESSKFHLFLFFKRGFTFVLLSSPKQ